MSKIIKIKNEYIEVLPDFLGAFALDEKQASARRRFVRDIKGFKNDLIEAKKELQNKYATKDSKGEIKTKDNEVEFSKDNLKKVTTEWNKIMAEYVIIDVTPANEQDIKTISDFLKAEQKRFIEEKKNKFTAADYDYSYSIEEIVKMITPVEAKNK